MKTLDQTLSIKHSLKSYWVSVFSLLFHVGSVTIVFSQTTNVGNNFWLGYMGHIDGTSSSMSLYITSSVNTSGTVDIPAAAWSSPFTVLANTTTSVSIPPGIAHVGCTDCISDKGIHITSIDPVVVYSHIFSNPRSDATLVLPVPTLGNNYIVMGYPQHAGTAVGYSEFLVVSVEDNTIVDITPSSLTFGGQPAGVTFTVTLNEGEMYQVQSTTDLTGSVVHSTGGSGTCKRVAVFSGSTYIKMGCTGASTGDNLYTQDFPTNAWGKEFVTAPYKTRLGDLFRVLASEDTTTITFNGVVTAILDEGEFWDTITDISNYILADKPIAVAQFQRTQNCDNITGDPSLTILSPIEQTLDSITVYNSPFLAITGQYINIIMKTQDTATFSLDGLPVPFVVSPSNLAYSFAQMTVTSGNHNLFADSGFIAVAYGMGNLESYVYNAGANVKNLQQEIILTGNGIGNLTTTCPDVPITFNPVTSYVPLSWLWYFGDGDTSSTPNPQHAYSTGGDYTISLVTLRPGASGCESYDSSTTIIHIVQHPVAAFSVNIPCVGDTSFFTDSTTNPGGTTLSSWSWKFGDGDSASLQNPFHQYSFPGWYNVTLFTTTDVGCFDSVIVPVYVYPPALAQAGTDTSVCPGTAAHLAASGGVTYAWSPATATTQDSASATDAFPPGSTYFVVEVIDTNGCHGVDSVFVSVFPSALEAGPDLSICPGSFALLEGSGGKIYSWSPVSSLSSGTGQSVIAKPLQSTYYQLEGPNIYGCPEKDTLFVFVFPSPEGAFTADPDSGPRPLPVSFTNQTSGATEYFWDFGDGQTSKEENPEHFYHDFGSFTVTLISKGPNGCPDTVLYQFIVTDNSHRILIPNVFTPNGDGVNDFFLLEYAGFKTLEGEIYNRWGKHLATIDFLNESWNGKNKEGQEMETGVYFYLLKGHGYDGDFYEYRGFVELLK